MLVRRLDPDLFFKEVVDQFKQILTITKNNILVGIKKRLNFVDSSRITWSITDNPTNKSVDIGVTALHADTATSSTSAAGLTDGDYGDVVVSSSGTVMTVDSLPESRITNLVTDLAGKVPTTRTISTTLPITGGGDLSANRTLAFDGSTLLDNNARVKVDKAGVGVGTRRELNFIEGSNITITVTDDNPNEKVDIEIASSGGGGSGLTHPETMSRILQLC